MRLIVGLGNPGRRYRGTRHNMGREVVEHLAAACGIRLDARDGRATTGGGTVAGQRVLLAWPETYMNVAGPAVADLRRRHRIALAHLLVVYDDLDLPPGTIRFREQGSAGGHNGLQSVIEALGTTAFPRLRVGIGRPPAGMDPADYVLERPTPEERARLDDAVARAVEGIVQWVRDGPQAAMRFCNARPVTPRS
ncbi:MAG: aminoacyl-tRNA hydrolase [Armatimonadota bacterium]|nr:aminoacyl-tRNA hydrolase [Armatimonadota bacterium]MDR7484976.1 aminoacyl-tRNA hydrolase [Armatimonadota bacterium]MDR7533679.1 aminoacyl-tRNA hydrolase [Armatimonadota bacterium]MDR7535490.1 aminoacyl-tRNA hydrolase [Armatimonadota bacterium]